MSKCKYELRDGYYIFSDFNFCKTEEEMKLCKNKNVDLDGIRRERLELLLKAYNFLGSEDFMKLQQILDNCSESYFPTDRLKSECDYHHCCECWEKELRELNKNIFDGSESN